MALLKSTDRTPYLARLDPALLQRIREIAAIEERSINTTLQRALRLYIEQHERLNVAP